MEQAFFKFLLKVGDTRVANSVVSLLKSDTAAKKYGGDNRNQVVKALAVDAEADIGSSAYMMFRMPGPFHDALQDLMDEFWDFVDEHEHEQTA